MPRPDGGGWTPDQARAEALRAMGEPETLREEYRPARAEERHFYYMAWHYVWTFALCILLGMAFGYMSVRPGKSAAA